jgi:hypothetical protein
LRVQRLDPLDIVEIAEVLHIVTHSIDEEAARRVVSTNCGLIAVAFALSHRDTGHVADNIRHSLHPLIGDDVPIDHGNRLRHVAEQCVGLGRGSNPMLAVRRRALSVDLDRGEHLWGRVGSREGVALGEGRARQEGEGQERSEAGVHWSTVENEFQLMS